MRRRRHRTYEYGYNEPSPYHERIRRSPGSVLLDGLLFFLVIPVPLIGLLLYLTEVVPIPALWLVAYTAVTQTLAGLLFLILTARHAYTIRLRKATSNRTVKKPLKI